MCWAENGCFGGLTWKLKFTCHDYPPHNATIPICVSQEAECQRRYGKFFGLICAQRIGQAARIVRPKRPVYFVGTRETPSVAYRCAITMSASAQTMRWGSVFACESSIQTTRECISKALIGDRALSSFSIWKYWDGSKSVNYHKLQETIISNCLLALEE